MISIASLSVYCAPLHMPDGNSSADGDHSSVGEDKHESETGSTPARYELSTLAAELAGQSSLFREGSKSFAPLLSANKSGHFLTVSFTQTTDCCTSDASEQGSEATEGMEVVYTQGPMSEHSILLD